MEDAVAIGRYEATNSVDITGVPECGIEAWDLLA